MIVQLESFLKEDYEQFKILLTVFSKFMYLEDKMLSDAKWLAAE